MEKIAITIRIPEHFRAEDELSNLLNDDGMLDDLQNMIASAIEQWVSEAIEGITWRDVEVQATEFVDVSKMSKWRYMKWGNRHYVFDRLVGETWYPIFQVRFSPVSNKDSKPTLYRILSGLNQKPSDVQQ